MSSLCQGSESEPRQWSTRLIFLIMFVASLVLFNVFSASYTSFLSVVQTAKPFSTIQELEATDYKVGGPPGSAYTINFEVSQGHPLTRSFTWLIFVLKPLDRPASSNIVNTRWVTTTNMEAFQKMKTENYAFIQASQAIYQELGGSISVISSNKYLLRTSERTGETCNIVEIGPNLFNGNLVMAWKKNFPYAPILNY